MTYQQSSVGKMGDFETLILCISLKSSQMCKSVNSSCEQNSVHSLLLQRAACDVKEINGS